MMVVHQYCMGLETREPGNYITILGGKFCKRVGETTPGAVARVLEKGQNAGKTVYELYYDSLTAKLIGIKTQDGGVYGKNWMFTFKDGDDVYNLQLSYSNSFSNALLKMLPNVDVSIPMKLMPSVKLDAESGKNKSSLFINQNGNTVKHFYTKDNPNGLPQMVQKQFKGQMVWDDTDQLAFLEDMVMGQIVPKLEGAPATQTVVQDFGPTQKSKEDSLDTFVDNINGKSADEDEF